MQATGTQAIIPKARGMWAKRISPAEYEELMRRRTVPEVAAILKRHPYFRDSLATLTIDGPHRSQLEELLSMDIFTKYEGLLHYDFTKDNFYNFYLMECETKEIIKALQQLSIGLKEAYIKLIPPYLEGRTRLDLFAMGQAHSFEELLEVLRFTPYYRVLRARYLADPTLSNFPLTEAALLTETYGEIFALVEKSVAGRDAEAINSLFLQELEEHNLEVLVRVKTYYPHIYNEHEIRQLLLPYYYHIKKRRMEELVRAPGPEELMALYRQIPSINYTGPATPEGLATAGGRRIYRHAMQVMRLTGSPTVALTAFVSLAKLERENVVTVIEGVRYGLPPEQIRSMLRY